jgi:hypothetical protein
VAVDGTVIVFFGVVAAHASLPTTGGSIIVADDGVLEWDGVVDECPARSELGYP